MFNISSPCLVGNLRLLYHSLLSSISLFLSVCLSVCCLTFILTTALIICLSGLHVQVQSSAASISTSIFYALCVSLYFLSVSCLSKTFQYVIHFLYPFINSIPHCKRFSNVLAKSRCMFIQVSVTIKHMNGRKVPTVFKNVLTYGLFFRIQP